MRERPKGENEFVDIPAYQRWRWREWQERRDGVIRRARELEGKARMLKDVCSCGRHHALGIYDEEGKLRITICPREYYVAKFLYYSLDPRNDPLDFLRQYNMGEFLERMRINKEGEDGSGDSDRT
jgi:hypothetical protein